MKKENRVSFDEPKPQLPEFMLDWTNPKNFVVFRLHDEDVVGIITRRLTGCGGGVYVSAPGCFLRWIKTRNCRQATARERRKFKRGWLPGSFAEKRFALTIEEN